MSQRYVDSGADCRLRLRTTILFVGLGGMANSFMMFCSTEYVLCYLLNNRVMSKQIVLYGEGQICHYLIEMCNYSGQKFFENHRQLTLLLRPLGIRIEHRSTWQLCETQVQPTHRRTCTTEHQRTWRQTKSLAKSNCDKKTLD